MQGIIITTNGDGSKPSCVLKVTLVLYCLIPGKPNRGTFCSSLSFRQPWLECGKCSGFSWRSGSHKALRESFSNSVPHHIYCTELTFTFALAIQEKMNILFHKPAIKSTIFTSLLELCNGVKRVQQRFQEVLKWNGKGLVYFSVERKNWVLVLRLMLKVTYLLVMGLRPDLSIDLCSHHKSTLPFKRGAGESWSHTARWNCYLAATWKYELFLLLGTAEGKTWISSCFLGIKAKKPPTTGKLFKPLTHNHTRYMASNFNLKLLYSMDQRLSWNWGLKSKFCLLMDGIIGNGL